MLASSLAIMFSEKRKVVACDCDVDAPNLGLWLGIEKYDYYEKISTSEKALINSSKCIKCGKCLICRHGAIKKNEEYTINSILCEGCGLCKVVCPVGAIDIKPVENGEIRIKKTMWNFPLISGQLYPGESGSGKIVTEVKKKAESFDYEIMIIDSAAGIGCPVIASITGCNFAILVTEPTPSGISDLKRILKIVNHFKIPYGIVINKYDINKEFSKIIEKMSGKHFLGKISYDEKVVYSIVNLKPVLYSDSKIVKEIKEVFKKLNTIISIH